MTIQDQDRAAFERWARQYGRIFIDRDGEGYVNRWTQEAWVGWQARAREKLEELQERTIEPLLWDEHPECCGNPVVGAEYMGERELVCCGCPERAPLSDAQIVATLRSMFPKPTGGGL